MTTDGRPWSASKVVWLSSPISSRGTPGSPQTGCEYLPDSDHPRCRHERSNLGDGTYQGEARGRQRPPRGGAVQCFGWRCISCAAVQARGTGFANTVTEAGWEGHKKHLGIAEEALRASWDADPTDPEVATEMIRVCLGRSLPRDEMELWFKRAMEADGDYRNACAAKFQYLLPKWHGTRRTPSHSAGLA